MKNILAILILLSLNTFCLAKVEIIEITGTVTAKNDGQALPGVNVIEKSTHNSAVSDVNGGYKIKVHSTSAVLVFSSVGFITKEINVGLKQIINVAMEEDVQSLDEVVVIGYGNTSTYQLSGAVAGVSVRHRNHRKKHQKSMVPTPSNIYSADRPTGASYNTEGYAAIHENEFLAAAAIPLSTFSIDVDAASYSNLRRYLNNGQNPPKDAVRIEEMINYFNYDYSPPTGDNPFSINTEVASCPWNEAHKLVHIGLQGEKIDTDQLPPSNLVFLIDVSGSMQDYNKLPLLKSALQMLVKNLRPQDRVSIVVYAGAAGLVLPATSGEDKSTIIHAINRLSAGGSTAGGAGIKLAYQVAQAQYMTSGNNRIILATDGDFNIGASSNAEMERLIEKEREKGIYLSVIGLGMGNYKDDKMEILADKGNGNYAYIDNIQEAKKVFVHEFGGTLFTIAKDVKIQVEFNPVLVQSYRLIGYENRKLNDADFNDDKKDAGELGSGHTVTALYEIIPVGVANPFDKTIDSLKYQSNKVRKPAKFANELMTVKLRYKRPRDTRSQLIVTTINNSETSWKETSNNFRWSSAVAAFGMLLRESKFSQQTDLSAILNIAKGAEGKDREGYRREFIKMISVSGFLTSSE